MTIPDTIEEETDSYRYLFSNKDDLKKSFWKKIHFGRVVVWCGVNLMIIHFSEASILWVSVLLFAQFFQSSWCLVSSSAWN